nr:hypothetical protein [Tanacetum cinerariifolium]
SLKNQSWPLIEPCACLDHHLNPPFSSKIVGFHLSWVMEVVEKEKDHYPLDFEGCCREKGGEKMYSVSVLLGEK